MIMSRSAAFAAAFLALTALTTIDARPASPHTSGLTGALYAAGGGAGSFSVVRALNSMVGEPAVESEMLRLQEQYGDTNAFVEEFDFAMTDAWKRAGKANVSVNTASDLTGHELATAVISAGTQRGVFTVQRLFGALFPPQIAAEVLIDVDTKYGADSSTNFQKTANAFFTDTGQTLGVAALKGADQTP